MRGRAGRLAHRSHKPKVGSSNLPPAIFVKLADDATNPQKNRTAHASSTFIDNMCLPVHRWFMFSAGFSAQWVESVIRESDPDTCVKDACG